MKSRKKIKKTKMAWGGTPFNMETPQQAMERYNKNTMLAQLEAQQAAAPYEFIGGMLLNTGLSLAGKGIQAEGGFGGLLGKEGKISKFGAGLDTLFGFESSLPITPIKGKKLDLKTSGAEDYLKNLKLPDSAFNIPQIFATGGIVGSNIPIEAEGGEVMEIPGMGPIELNGPSHENGGIDMNVPMDTEFYSKRLKGADGKTMAKRKKEREQKLKKLEKLAKENPTDKAIQKTYQKMLADNQRLDAKDLQEMNFIKSLQDSSNMKMATGGSILPPEQLMFLEQLNTYLNGYGVGKSKGEIEEVVLNKPKVLSAKKPEPIFNTPKANVEHIDIPDTVLPDFTQTATTVNNKNKINWNNILKSVRDNNPLANYTLGDAIGMYAGYQGSKDLMNNTIRQWEQTPEEINHHANFGKKGLNKIQEQYGILEGIKDNALLNSELSRTGTINRNSNATRGVNTLRALNLVADAQHDKLASDIMNNYSIQKLGVMDKEAQQLDKIDDAVMTGEMNRADRHLRNQDSFFSNLARNISTKYENMAKVGKLYNDKKEADLTREWMNRAYPIAQVDRDGSIKIDTSTAIGGMQKTVTPINTDISKTVATQPIVPTITQTNVVDTPIKRYTLPQSSKYKTIDYGNVEKALDKLNLNINSISDVKNLQKLLGLKQDGIFGPLTYSKLIKNLN